MSAGYASRLSSYPNKGICGLSENFDTPRTYQKKIQKLIQYVQQSKYTVIITGAGISTSAGIPDFRGPSGIWTVEQQKQQQEKLTNKKRKRSTLNSTKDNSLDTEDMSPSATTTPLMNFSDAKPTLTHRIITKLVQGDEDDGDDVAPTRAMNHTHHIQFVITQNVDGLHRRSGLSRNFHSVLHGCTFTELCRDCLTEYFRNFDIGTIGFRQTGRFCTQCCDGTSTVNNNDQTKHDVGKLYDTVLDWEDPLPEYDYQRSIEHCTRADLLLCLGTSLRIQPVNELPLLAKQFVIVNLQITPFDAQAVMVLRQRTDVVMADLLNGLTGRDLTQSESDGTPHHAIEQTWKIPVPVRQEVEESDDDE